ncbi:phosphoribosylamine--glycine ligase [Alicyclobacillus tolerans]|uniref:phosphoribosylamine--glycine ligase n=1 Tax=Alicyclobacillus tolerans TaxID=90970 RepID=UPI0009F8B134|nr:phosphoribosylamine--glycine ligase [Alicyclobacillus montanus]
MLREVIPSTILRQGRLGERRRLALTETLRVLVIGSGAREHALIWKLAQSNLQPELYVAPGNPGMEKLATRVPLSEEDVAGIVRFAQEKSIRLVVIGPEAPLALGLADELEAAGILAFGPKKAAARLEWSKAYAKEMMQRAHVPTAASATFSDLQSALDYLDKAGKAMVVKADGLAKGKGVIVAESLAETRAAVEQIMKSEAGARVVLEERMTGREVSLMYFVDEHFVQPMLPARDHKRIGEGDTGPNTGGMGVFAPVPSFTPTDVEEVTRRIVQPILSELKKDGIVYCGVLYVGLMVTANGPKVVEFNARFGDPETEAILPLLETDLLEVCLATARHRLSDVQVSWRSEAAVTVILAAEGYPGTPRKGDTIVLPPIEDWPKQTVIFQAGTDLSSTGELVSAGGRVLAVTATGADAQTAAERAYALANAVEMKGKYLRRDLLHDLDA